MNQMIQWIKSKIGCGYVYGATGWTCSQKRLEQQAKQYPEYADTILNTCKKWIGVQCFDCAQLIRRALESVGLSAPSGATSQWNADIWAEKGDIADMPNVLCALYRQKGSKMQHTGWHIGDGVTVDARGSKSGVVLSTLDKYSWTHYAVPNWDGMTGKDDSNMSEELNCIGYATVITASGDLNFRTQPSTSSARLTACNTIPRGAIVDVLEYVNDDWARVRFFGYVGYVSRKFLQDIPAAQPDDDADDIETATGCENVEGVRVIHRIQTADGQTIDIDGKFSVSVVFLDDAGNEL